jgi:hypothetical protein
MKSAWPAAARWHPAPTTAPWQWQLQGKTDTSFEAGVYDVDGFETPTSVVRRLHARGRHVVCYLDVGSWESFRPDAGAFPRSVIGCRYEGFPNERWLDVRRFHLFAEPLERRFDICARTGFDAVEPGNIAGWENKTGFPIGAGAQLRFNRPVARQVHSRGMAVALKNDGGQVRQLLGSFDFAIVEQCFQYEECGAYKPFIKADKAVFEAKYELEPSTYCDAAGNWIVVVALALLRLCSCCDSGRRWWPGARSAGTLAEADSAGAEMAQPAAVDLHRGVPPVCVRLVAQARDPLAVIGRGEALRVPDYVAQPDVEAAPQVAGQFE